MLAPPLAAQISPDSLRERFFEMFCGYSDGDPYEVWFDPQFSNETWPAKMAGDVGWAYVGINGDDFNEAVTLTLCEHEGRLLIRDVEWGRP